MMKCKQCGYENPDDAVVCEICAEPLGNAGESAAVQQAVPQGNVGAPAARADAVEEAGTTAEDGNEYFVICPESQTKTMLPGGNVTTFYCQGCKKQHEIDGILWSIEKRAKAQAPTFSNVTQQQQQPAPKGDNLWLEEINSHVRIDIDKAGGTLGRYGTYGADFFQSRGLLVVSGEHCRISYQYGTWVLQHISRTNPTMYNNMPLTANEPIALEDGKVLTLANTVSFIVRIG